ncbi:uncharacterized protein K452DRAFT_252055 [Aplosporella prunicola CBS 121167]|uniref:Concanavalin A-like lectin/glucanase n=1 Tax=Aplosporella prunicola CBS 121167 TaxID=1176127 RepID=A0A6A6BA75_9PEZI|nr:uncharacterized protein K452DRAFT_252055 [Aplosporella prunicola CBS 121167]KAF2141152.1 hypothetical protein K452DRAFT_252055 [Aplosporella prunicola CBS 121167]
MHATTSTALATLAFALGAAADDYAFGKTFYLGPTSGDAYITKATYSVAAPPVPCNYGDSTASNPIWMSFWIGFAEDVSDSSKPFVQPYFNWAPDQESQGCPASNDAWCVTASTYFESGQKGQDYVAVPKNANLDFEVTSDGKGTIEQTVTMNGKVVSQQSDDVGFNPTWFFGSNECYSDDCGTLNSYEWTDVVINLSAADKAFADTLSADGVIIEGLSSSDGKVWKADSIKVSKDHFPASESSSETCS